MTHYLEEAGARAYAAQTAISPEAIEQNRRLFAIVAALANRAHPDAREA